MTYIEEHKSFIVPSKKETRALLRKNPKELDRISAINGEQWQELSQIEERGSLQRELVKMVNEAINTQKSMEDSKKAMDKSKSGIVAFINENKEFFQKEGIVTYGYGVMTIRLNKGALKGGAYEYLENNAKMSVYSNVMPIDKETAMKVLEILVKELRLTAEEREKFFEVDSFKISKRIKELMAKPNEHNNEIVKMLSDMVEESHVIKLVVG